MCQDGEEGKKWKNKQRRRKEDGTERKKNVRQRKRGGGEPRGRRGGEGSKRYKWTFRRKIKWRKHKKGGKMERERTWRKRERNKVRIIIPSLLCEVCLSGVAVSQQTEVGRYRWRVKKEGEKEKKRMDIRRKWRERRKQRDEKRGRRRNDEL